jgi:HSP90 family molecular chaperone
VDLIGKFGVGFYSSFMVAREIHIYTKSFKKDSGAYLWKSKGDSSYSIEDTAKKQRGTRIELLLKKEEREFLDKFNIKNIISKHSKFIPFPIYIENEKIESVEAIWTQPKSALKPEDYIEFYKFFENTQEDPETYIHLSSDAPVQFNAILFIPQTSFELLGLFKSESGVDLYSKKILIQKACKDIMPEYLRFVKGVIDSEDIPLNISRETIQNNIKINKIQKHILKKIFDHFDQIKKKNMDQYLKIWNNFNRNFKEGIATDFTNREKISPLLLFHSSKIGREEYTDLDAYISRMQKDQEYIFYVSGFDLESVVKNPALEAFGKKEIEVLYLTDPLDEIVIDHLKEFQSKKFKLVESADIKLDDEKEIQKDKEYLKDIENYLGYLKVIYGERIADVKISKRLVDSPCILVNPSDGPSVQMEKIMKMVNKEYSFSKKVFEINPDNELIKELIRIHKNKPDSEELKTLSLQMLDNMMMREGVLDNIETVVPQIQGIMLKAAKSL